MILSSGYLDNLVDLILRNADLNKNKAAIVDGKVLAKGVNSVTTIKAIYRLAILLNGSFSLLSEYFVIFMIENHSGILFYCFTS